MENDIDTIPTPSITSPAPSQTEKEQSPPTNDTSNPWLSTTNKPRQKPSTTRIQKIQNKNKIQQSSNVNTNATIDVSQTTINKSLSLSEDEESPNMTYSKGKISFQQKELVNRAFATDSFDLEFQKEKQQIIMEDAPKEENLSLPGWGTWTGKGIKKHKPSKVSLVKQVPGIQEGKRKDAKLKNVIISEKLVKNVCGSLFL
jgi:U3 small nucleolar RNA-associated protein 14